MKKKILTVILATALSISLVACGNSSDSKKDEKKTEETTKKEDKKEDVVSGKVEQINLDNSEGTLTYTRHELTTDYNSAPAIRIYFNYTNKSDKTKSAQSTFYPQVFQNGVECDFTMGNFDEQNEASSNLSKELQKGTTLEVAFLYAIQDNTNPVTVKVNDQSADNLLDDIYQEQELALQ